MINYCPEITISQLDFICNPYFYQQRFKKKKTCFFRRIKNRLKKKQVRNLLSKKSIFIAFDFLTRHLSAAVTFSCCLTEQFNCLVNILFNIESAVIHDPENILGH